MQAAGRCGTDNSPRKQRSSINFYQGDVGTSKQCVRDQSERVTDVSKNRMSWRLWTPPATQGGEKDDDGRKTTKRG